LIQEWWGLNQSICKTAEVFAEQGFAVLAIDIYRGKCADSRESAGHLFKGLDFAGAIQDIKAAAESLKGRGYQKIGITGFCMGGALTIAAVASGDEFSAAIPFYGVPDLSHFNLANIKIPVLAHFGDKDDAKGFSDPETAYKLEKAAKEAGVNFTLHMWPAGHAFMNQSKPDVYEPEIAKQALAESIAFFQAHLTA
jgi:carboxymethylenebutenolidase